MSNTILVNAASCPQDHACPLVDICPVGAISQVDFQAPVIDSDKCIGCGSCVNSCAHQAVTFA